MTFDWIAFDADDTLWHNEVLYAGAQNKLRELLSPYAGGGAVDNALYAKEMGNLPDYGYGIKSFTLSMIETAIDLTDGQIAGSDVGRIIGFAKEMLTAEVQLIDAAGQTVQELCHSHQLMLITKGDLRTRSASSFALVFGTASAPSRSLVRRRSRPMRSCCPDMASTRRAFS